MLRRSPQLFKWPPSLRTSDNILPGLVVQAINSTFFQEMHVQLFAHSIVLSACDLYKTGNKASVIMTSPTTVFLCSFGSIHLSNTDTTSNKTGTNAKDLHTHAICRNCVLLFQHGLLLVQLCKHPVIRAVLVSCLSLLLFTAALKPVFSWQLAIHCVTYMQRITRCS